FYTFVFNKVNYEAVILEDGDLFLEKLKNEKFDLIIMDINLKNTYFEGKKIDGVWLSRYIKTDAELNNIPIIVVTAYSINAATKNMFSDSLADDYIIKPIHDINMFLTKLNSLMK
ncbi:MAG: response regulator, partial [Melioribacteraceae bacterium]|nr:response regulator [Melioribacteraceae bacterium]